MPRGRATLQDVAKLAGVSAVTVSRVINKSAGVRAGTALRVSEAITKLNYVPDSVARSLVTGRTNRYLLLIVNEEPISPTTWAYELPIIEGICEHLRDTPMQLQISMCFKEDLETPTFIPALLDQVAVDGVLVLSAWPVGHHNVHEFARRGLDYMLVGCHSPVRPLRQVEFDNSGAVQLVVGRLIELGHSVFALIAGRQGQLHAEERAKGFRGAIRSAGLEVHENLVMHGDFNIASGYRLMRELLEETPRPTAIVCGNDHMAVGAMKALREQGLSVPADFSVVGFDDHQIAEVVQPSLSSVRIPLRDLGVEATKRLMRIGSGTARGEQVSVILPTQFVERESIGRRS